MFGRATGKATELQSHDMPASQSDDESAGRGNHQWFATTHWSVVLAAKTGDSQQADQALEKLCRTYWPPLYAYIRRDGHDPTEAQDLTQEFFARLLAREYLQNLHHQEGKFRSFLLAYVKNFLVRTTPEGRRPEARRRVRVHFAEPADGEEGYLLEPVDELTPNQVFDRRWAQSRPANGAGSAARGVRSAWASRLVRSSAGLPASRTGRTLLRATG